MIKTKLKTILNARDAVLKIAQKDLPVTVSYCVVKLINAINAELEIYDAQRIKLCEKYGQLSESKTSYIIPEGSEFNNEHRSLLDFEVELDVQKVILPGNINITPVDLISLSEFIEIEGVNDD